MPEINEELLQAGRSTNGGWNQAQFALLGVAWPPQKGWKLRLIGSPIEAALVERFIALKDFHLKPPDSTLQLF